MNPLLPILFALAFMTAVALSGCGKNYYSDAKLKAQSQLLAADLDANKEGLTVDRAGEIFLKYFPKAEVYFDLRQKGSVDMYFHTGSNLLTLIVEGVVRVEGQFDQSGYLVIQKVSKYAEVSGDRIPPNRVYGSLAANPRVVVLEGTSNAYSETAQFQEEQKEAHLITSFDEFFYVEPLILGMRHAAEVSQLLRKARPDPENKFQRSMPQALFKLMLDEDGSSYHLYGSAPYIMRLTSDRGEVLILDAKDRQKLLDILNHYKRHGEKNAK